MTMLRNFSNRSYYLLVIFTTGCVLILTFSTVLYRHYNYAQRTTGLTIHNYQVLHVARLILIDLLNMETGMRGYMLTGDPKFLQPYDEAMVWLDSDMSDVKKLVAEDPKNAGQIAPLFLQIRKFKALLLEGARVTQRRGHNAATEKYLESQKESMDHLRQSIQNFVQQVQNDLNAQLASAKQKQQNYLYVLVSGTAGVISALLMATLALLSLMARNQKAEAEIHKSEERFRMIMNGTNDGLYDFDLINHTVYYSPQYRAMLGYSDEEHPNTIEAFDQTLHPDDQGRAWESFAQLQKRTVPYYVNYYRLRHKDGSWRWIMDRGVGIWDDQGHLTRLIGTHTDITEQKRREEELKELNTDLETFAYITSHDLRSPLVNLKGFAGEMAHTINQVKPLLERMESSLTPEEKQICTQAFEEDIPEALNFIQKSVEKMDILTSAVLDLSRIGRRDLRFAPVDTANIVNRSLGSLAYELNQRDIEVEVGSLPTIISDLTALEQIFGNLIDNAVKYLDPNRSGKITISCAVHDKEIIFTIADNGRGINEQDHQKVFEIFRRARNANDVRGMGMGLAYVKATLRKLDGIIWFDSVLGEGTSFHFQLPLIPATMQAEEKINDTA